MRLRIFRILLRIFLILLRIFRILLRILRILLRILRIMARLGPMARYNSIGYSDYRPIHPFVSNRCEVKVDVRSR
jgi:hypothetical protein